MRYFLPTCPLMVVDAKRHEIAAARKDLRANWDTLPPSIRQSIEGLHVHVYQRSNEASTGVGQRIVRRRLAFAAHFRSLSPSANDR